MIGYPSRQDGAILPAQDYPLYPANKIHQKPYNKSFVDQVCSVKMAGYWPCFFCEFINTQKKNLANIQPSLPRTWSITHTQRPAFNTMSMRLLRRYVGARVLITLGRCGDQHGFREKIECMSTGKPSYAGNLVTWQLSDHVMIWWKFISITARIVYLLQPCGTLTSPMATSFTWFSLINSSTPSRSCKIRAR